MSVKNQHPDYVLMAPKWKRCRDAAAGQDAIHAAGVEYLPKLKDQTDEDYKAYKMRASFYNATWRTVAGMLGMLFRKPPTVEVPASIEPLLADVTLSGMPLQIFAQNASEEAVVVGRVGIFVDYPVAGPDTTLADAKLQNLRPSMAIRKAESIINWRQRTVNNEYVLSMVVLVESHGTPKDEFEDVYETRYRVLDLTPDTSEYRIRLFRVKKDEQTGQEVDEQIGEDQYPLLNGARMNSIPLWILGVDDIDPACDEPPLIDLVDTNLSHYRTNADYEHGCHFTGLPTPVVSGYAPENGPNGEPPDKLYIGSGAAWVFPNPQASASFLEFTGQGLSALEKNLERKEAQMAVLGARMLEVQKKAAEAAETAGIHRSGENSVLSSAAQILSLGLTRALKTFCAWAGTPDEKAAVSLNRDFFPMQMDSAKLLALTDALQKRGISFETYFQQLQQGEIIATSKTVEEEGAAIGANPGQSLDKPEPATANQ